MAIGFNMITSKEMMGKSSIELIELLLKDIKQYELKQINLFIDLLKINLLKSEKAQIEPTIQDLVDYAKRGSDENDSNAIYVYGILNVTGIGLTQNVNCAKKLFEQAIALGHTQSINNLANIYRRGQGVERNYAAAIELYKKAAALDNRAGLFNLALMYKTGQGVERNYAAAIELYKQAAAMDYAPAMSNLALMYKTGQGVEPNYPKAIELYEKAAELGHASAMCNLALMYKNGHGVAPNHPKAIELLTQAVKLGSPVAMFNLALMYKKGQGVERNYLKAAELLTQAVELGHADAMFNLALMYKKGQGVEPNDPKAIELYEKAVELGHADAMFNLALMYENGQGVEPNYLKAIELYEKAVALGDAGAMFSLALLYQNGFGCNKDLSKAARLFRKAVEKDGLLSIEHLKISIEPTYRYHHHMLNNDVENTVKLLKAHADLVGEFIEYDFLSALSNPKTLKRINAVMEQYKQSLTAQVEEKAAYQHLNLSLLKACNEREASNPEQLSEELAILKINCLNALDINEISEDELPPICEQIINLWYGVDGFTDVASSLLTKILNKAELKSVSLDSFYLKNIALILVKKLYGEEYGITPNEWNQGQVLLLIGFLKLPVKPPLDVISLCIGKEHIIHRPTEAVLDKNPQPSMVTVLGFFVESNPTNVEGEPKDSQVNPALI